MIGECKGCGAETDVEPVRLGQQSIMLCELCIKEWELNK
jgi:hypothetical protein